MTTTRRSRTASLLTALLLGLALAVACGGDDAIDVSQAKPDDETVTPADDETPAEPDDGETTAGAGDDEPASDAPAEEPAPADPDDRQPAGGVAQGVRRLELAEPETVNGWTRLSPPADLFELASSPDGQAILGSGRGGGLLSTDAGATWARLDWPGEARFRGAISPDGLAIVVAGFSPPAGFELASLRSEDGGFDWSEGVEAPAVAWFVLDSFLYAVPGRGVLASNDGGASGTLLAEADQAWPVGTHDPFAISTDPTNIDRWAVISTTEGGTAAVWVTADGGESFAPLAPGFALWGLTVPVFSTIGPLVMSQGVGVLFSFDQGESWFAQNQGLESLEADGSYAALIDFVALNDGGLPVVATADTVYAFDPRGWRATPGPGAPIRALAVAGENGRRLLAATDDGLWAIEAAALDR